MNRVLRNRALSPLDLLLAVLGGIGLQAVLDDGHRPVVRRSLAGLLLLAAAVMLLAIPHQVGSHLPSASSAARTKSLVWAGLQVAALFALLGVIVDWAKGQTKAVDRVTSRHPLVPTVAVLLSVEAAFFLTASPNLMSSSSQAFARTRGEATLERLVGHHRVGLGACPSPVQLPNLGILAEANSAYGIEEFAAYDPILPKSYWRSWNAASGSGPLTPTELEPMKAGFFCPSITSVALARRYGVVFILEPPGHAAPQGARLVQRIEADGLHRVPGAGLVTLEPAVRRPARSEIALPVSAADPTSLHFSVTLRHKSVLHIHIADVPGWSASVDGSPLSSHPWSDAMLDATVPACHRTIVISYFPPAFAMVLVIAGAALVVLVIRPRRLDGP